MPWYRLGNQSDYRDLPMTKWIFLSCCRFKLDILGDVPAVTGGRLFGMYPTLVKSLEVHCWIILFHKHQLNVNEVFDSRVNSEHGIFPCLQKTPSCQSFVVAFLLESFPESPRSKDLQILRKFSVTFPASHVLAKGCQIRKISTSFAQGLTRGWRFVLTFWTIK